MVARPSQVGEGCVERTLGATTTAPGWTPSGDDSPGMKVHGACGTLCYKSNPKPSDRFAEGRQPHHNLGSRSGTVVALDTLKCHSTRAYRGIQMNLVTMTLTYKPLISLGPSCVYVDFLELWEKPDLSSGIDVTGGICSSAPTGSRCTSTMSCEYWISE